MQSSNRKVEFVRPAIKACSGRSDRGLAKLKSPLMGS